MSETTQFIWGICLLAVVYVLTRRYHTWRMGRAYRLIIQDLRHKGAFDPSSAVRLPYVTQSMFRVGMKDYRPKALEYLLTNSIIGMTESGGYYLIKRDAGLFDP
jgi:hypothetical protein